MKAVEVSEDAKDILRFFPECEMLSVASDTGVADPDSTAMGETALRFPSDFVDGSGVGRELVADPGANMEVGGEEYARRLFTSIYQDKKCQTIRMFLCQSVSQTIANAKR